MATLPHFREQAVFLRQASGSTQIEITLLKVLKVFKRFDIPHYVCGGFAVQEHGYPRFTVDVDIIVPDVAFAREELSINGFRPNGGSSRTLTDCETEVEVELLPGGSKVDSGPLTLPMPAKISSTPLFLTLEELISSKLSTYMGRGVQGLQDFADVGKLIESNELARDFEVESGVQDLYRQLRDELHAGT